jgi:hypothetical protein
MWFMAREALQAGEAMVRLLVAVVVFLAGLCRRTNAR